jgi:hypothetical protein
MFAHRLGRELGVLIALKIVALTMLFFLFFGPADQPKVDAAATARAILSERAP